MCYLLTDLFPSTFEAKMAECTGVETGGMETSMETMETGITVDIPNFQSLPPEIKLEVFGYLSVCERGVVSRVSKEWYGYMRDPTLWSVIDLSVFPLCNKLSVAHSAQHHCDDICYHNYRRRIQHFLAYLSAVVTHKPVIKRLRFAYDIGDYNDVWRESLLKFMKSINIEHLECAHLNWKETPIKPLCIAEDDAMAVDFDADQAHKCRHTPRVFLGLFEMFVKAAPRISKLILPFDWSEKSLRLLLELKYLQTLVVEKYFDYQNLNQAALDQLLVGLPSLARLHIEVWIASGHGMVMYSIRSSSLTCLDVSHSRGLYLEAVDLPVARVVKLGRHPWHGCIVTADHRIVRPCVHEVLARGAPTLQQLNEHVLRPGWTESSYDELELVLKSVCLCRRHYRNDWDV